MSDTKRLSVISSCSALPADRCRAGLGDHLGQVVVEQAAGRDVDRHGDLQPLASPALALGQRMLEHLAGERLDDPGLLGQRDEAVGTETTELGMVPARQRLDAELGAAVQRHLGLVVDDELAAVQPATQLGGQREAVDAVLVVLLGVGGKGGVGGLGEIQRDVRVAQQLDGGAPVGGEAGDADAGRDVQGQRIEVERAVQRVEQLAGDALGLRAGRRRSARANSSPPRRARMPAPARRGLQAPGDLDQHAVAELVPERVVDGLEVIEVEQQHGARAGPRARPRPARPAGAR